MSRRAWHIALFELLLAAEFLGILVFQAEEPGAGERLAPRNISYARAA